jgi:bifunctional DNA-binding transcriptional regulator/antitoxin component of YhaV-PrlF toxin-antitoxin module
VDDYYIQFPDDLLEEANLKTGDEVVWIDRGDGSFLLKKVTGPLGMNEF